MSTDTAKQPRHRPEWIVRLNDRLDAWQERTKTRLRKLRYLLPVLDMVTAVLDGLLRLGLWLLQSVHVLAVTGVVSAFSVILAVLFFSEPGLAHIIGQGFAQNCITNGLCSLSSNMAAFAVANIILASIVVFVFFLVARHDDSADDDLTELVTGVDNSQMAVIERLEEIEARLERLRDELLPLDPQGEPINGRDH